MSFGNHGTPWEITEKDISTLTQVAGAYRKFLADPFVIRDGEAVWIFAEEYSWARGSGRIVAWRLGNLETLRVVLDGLHHFAFPQVVRVNDQWVASCDTCSTPHNLYTFRQLGDPWIELEGGELPPGLVDPQLAWSPEASAWLLFATHWLSPEGRVSIWTSSDPTSSPWILTNQLKPSPLGRGGGTLDLRRGLRVIQIGQPTYGSGVHVQHLDFEESEGPALEFDGQHGWHTLVWDYGHSAESTNHDALVVVDSWTLIKDPLAALWKWNELRHEKRCRRNAYSSSGTSRSPS